MVQDTKRTGTAWKDRIQWILDRYEDGSRRAMGRKVGLSGQAISAWARGETKPSGEGLAAIIRTYPEIRARWLLTGRGAPRISANAPAGASNGGAGEVDVEGEADPGGREDEAGGRDLRTSSGAAEPGSAVERAYEAGRRDAVVEMMRLLGEVAPDG